MRFNLITLALFWLVLFLPNDLHSGEAKAAWQVEWENAADAAKKEGKLVAGIPASAELRKNLSEAFAKRFPAIELELTSARGPTNASKIAAEHAAGVRYYDILISGTLTPLSLLNAGILDQGSRFSCCRRSRIRRAGTAVICGPINKSDFFIRFKPISRKIFGTTRN